MHDLVDIANKYLSNSKVAGSLLQESPIRFCGVAVLLGVKYVQDIKLMMSPCSSLAWH